MRSSKAVNLAGKAEERSNLYAFLAAVYRREPSLEFLREIKSRPFLEALAEIGVSLGADVLDSSVDDLAEVLAVEYARLFLGPGKHIPPYEAAQREGALRGKTTAAVVAFIGVCGFTCAEDYTGLPDHISVELEFMQEITRREAVAWRAGDSAEARRCIGIEKDFMRDHLMRWTPSFCEKVVAGASSTFYRELATLTRGFIESEIADFDKSAPKDTEAKQRTSA